MNGVSIIIPTLNEAENIEELITRVLSATKKASLATEIVVVDDGSQDGTREKVMELSEKFSVSLVCRDHKKGLASAVIDGARHVRYDVVVVMDGDMSHSPEDVPRIAEPLLSGNYDIAIGSRYAPGGATPGWPLIRRIGSKVASFPAQILTGVNDPLAGFFAIKRAMLLDVEHEILGYKICLELIVKQSKQPKVAEVPVSFVDRQMGASKMNSNVLKQYFVQLVELCGATIPNNFWMVFAAMFGISFLVDMAAYSVSLRVGGTLIFAQVMGCLFSMAAAVFTARFFKPKNAVQAKLLCQPLFALWVFFLLVFRSGFLVLAQNSTWGQTLFASFPMAGFSALVISLSVILFFSTLKKNVVNQTVRFRLLLLATVLVSLGLRLLFGGSFELIHEEAYYWSYAQHPAIGYLDHPPMVALLIKISTFVFGNAEFAIRSAAIFCWCVATLFVALYTKEVINRDAALHAAAIMAVLPAFFGFGLIMTPDAPVIACWAATLFFARRAMVDMNGKNWFGVGAFLGLGLFSKYTIALLGPAFLVFLAIDSQARRWFVKPQPYIAAIIALLLFSPVILWNMENEWASFLFQTQGRLQASSEFSTHELLASILVMISPIGLLSAVYFLLFRNKFIDSNDQKARRQYAFAYVMVIVPLAVFFFFSLTKEVKLNWTSPLWLAAMPFMAMTLFPKNKNDGAVVRASFHKSWNATIVIFLLIWGGALHYFSIGLPEVPYPGGDPLLSWQDYAAQIDKLVESKEKESGERPTVVGMDLYKTASGLAFYRTLNFEKGDTTRQLPPLLETAGRNVVGQGAVMYDYWFSPEQFKGKLLLLVSPDKGDLEKRHFIRKIKLASRIRELKTTKNDQEVRPLFYRFVTVAQ